MRTVRRAEGKEPREPAGLALWERLQQWKAARARALEQRDNPQWYRWLTRVSSSDPYALPSARCGTACGGVQQIAPWLDSEGSRAEAAAPLCESVAGLEAGAEAWRGEIAAHLWKHTPAVAQGVLVSREDARLPRTNNALEICMGAVQKGHRHVTGRKNTTAFMLREGRAVARFSPLPAPADWVTRGAGVHWEHLPAALAEVRRTDERSQVWQARRNFSSYFHGLEARWSVAADSS